MGSVQTTFWVVALLVALAVAFDFMNGFHDAANSIATVVSTGIFEPHHAIIFASFFNVVAIGIFQLNAAAVKTMGQRITKHKPVGGFCAQAGGAITLFLATALGVPVSTTNTITGAIVGVGSVRRASAVRWGVAGTIVWAWIFTIPASALVAALFYWVGVLLFA